MKKISKILSLESGVSVIITFFVMIVILDVVLSVSILLYGEIKITRNIGNSVGSLYAAESGIEKVLYYDRQVLPLASGLSCAPSCLDSQTCVNGTCVASRGLCSMLVQASNPNSYCRDLTAQDAADSNDSNNHPSIYCNNTTGALDPNLYPQTGCSTCTSPCTISFSSTFGNDDPRQYYVTASIGSDYIDIQSKGTFGGAERKIEIVTHQQ